MREDKAGYAGIGCLLFLLACILVPLGNYLAGTWGVIAAFSLLGLFIVGLFIREYQRYLAIKPRLEAERALKTGFVSNGLRYFWRVGDSSRVVQFLQSELSIPSGWWASMFSDLPNFRECVLTTYNGIANLHNTAYDQSNLSPTESMRLNAGEVSESCADYLWIECHRLNLLAKNRADKNRLRPLLKKREKRLQEIQGDLSRALAILDEVIGE
jgi:hypothetical protein